ncbi:MAG: serine/threonine protein kinase [Candidatus Aenigmarchaeota archaeon]|nr:serine/threonine protein kinase [Candidatus Aenigmarchaeota archaeon]
MKNEEEILRPEKQVKEERPKFRELLGHEVSNEETNALAESAKARIAGNNVLQREDDFEDVTGDNAFKSLAEKVKSGSTEELGNYVATKYLNEGGLFYVLRGHSKGLDVTRSVALKIPKEKKFLPALEQHKDILLKLQQLNIPDIIDAQMTGEIPYVAEQLIEGETLADIIAKNKKAGTYLPEETVFDIARQTLSALKYMHEKGITHKDIKPHNILYKDGKVYVTDFNIADVVEQDEVKNTHLLTTASATRIDGFTEVYASPEQRQKKSVDQRTDLYSIGVSLFELLTNQICFGETSPKAYNPAIQRDFSSFFTKALKPRPEDRFQTAQEMIDALNALEKNKYGGGTIFYHTENSVYAVIFDAGKLVTTEIYQTADRNAIVDFCLSPDKKSIAVLEQMLQVRNLSYCNFPIVIKKIEEAASAVLFTAYERGISKIAWNTKGIHCKRRDSTSGFDEWAILDLVNLFLSNCGTAIYEELPLSPNEKYRLQGNEDKLLIVSTDRSSLETLQIAQRSLNFSLRKYVWTSTEYSKLDELNVKIPALAKSAKYSPKKVWYKPWTW